MLRKSECNQANLIPLTGKNYGSTAQIDEGYILVGSHLDGSTIDKIQKGEYVDFGKLVPKDKVLAEDDQRLEIIIKGGRTYYVPVSESTEITSFAKWEQAFRVNSNVYTRTNPHRATELIEYNHIIHTISLTYVWENVYLYDKDFRIHLARHPSRSWSIILQQAWSLRLRDRIHGHSYINSNHNVSNNGNSPQNKKKINEPCKRYNRGKCNFGTSCWYEHRGLFCFKLGHPIISCRKLAAAMEKATHRRRDGNGKQVHYQHKENSQHHGHTDQT